MSQAMPFQTFLSDALDVWPRLTRAQRVYCRVVFDRAEPAELAADDRAMARRLFGDVEHIPAKARHVCATVKGARAGGTWLWSLALLWRALTADLSGLAPGEQGFCVAVCPDLRLSRQVIRYARGAAKSCPGIAPLITSDTADGFVVRRPDGEVAIEALPASRGGAAGRGRSLLAALLDESSFFRDVESGVVNDSEVYRALVVRVVAGGILGVISTAWLESGLLWDLVQKNHGKPETALACTAPTELMREGDVRLAQVIAEERERDPQNAAREFDCVPFSQGAGLFFDGSAISAAIDDSLPAELEPLRLDTEHVLGAGFDAGFVRDASAGVIVRRRKDGPFQVAEVFERRPQKGAPLVPSRVVAEFAQIVKRHGGRQVAADQHYAESIREAVRAADLELVLAPGGQGGKVSTYIAVRDLLHGGRVQIPAGQRRLVQQLREVTARPTPGGGIVISSPRKHGGHGDVASAFVLALWRADFAARNAAADLSLIVYGSPRSENPGVRIVGARSGPQPPPGATGIVRSPTGISFNDPRTGQRVTLVAG